MRRLGLFLLGLAALLLPGAPSRAAAEEQEGDKPFSIHGEVRFRGELWHNLTDFTNTGGQAATDDDFELFPYRVRLGAGLDLGQDVSIYGEFQGVGQAGGGVFGQTGPFFGDDTELLSSGVHMYQGRVTLKDLGKSTMDLTIGRQEIAFDSGLHFSSLNYYNGISHDGVMASWDWENRSIQGFWIRPFEANVFATALTPARDADSDVLGVHYAQAVGKDHNNHAAAYAFFQLMNSVDLDPGQDRGKIYTVGGRWEHVHKESNGIVYSAEYSYQFGDYQPCAVGQNFVSNAMSVLGMGSATCLDNALDQRAYIFEGSAGYVWHTATSDRKFWAGLLVASGDNDPNDKKQEAFLPLFTDFHSRLGVADLFTPTNITDIGFGYQVNMEDRQVIGFAIHQFFKSEDGTAIVSPLSGVVLSHACFKGNVPSCETDLGREYDLTYTYNLSANFSGDIAIAFVKPGDTIQDQFSSIGNNVPDGEQAAWRVAAQVRARL